LYVVIQKIAPQGNLGTASKYGFSPDLGGKKWRRPEHAHASYPGLFFRLPGLSPYMGREERRVQGLDYEGYGFSALLVINVVLILACFGSFGPKQGLVFAL